MKIITVILSGLLIIAGSANAQSLDSTHKNWNVFTINQTGKKICYMTSVPTDKKGNYRRRNEPYALITYRGNNVSEVSFSSGYPYKKNGIVKLDVEGKIKSDLFTTEETPRIAWAKDAAEDKKLVEAMKAGSKMTVRGDSRLKTYSIDTYNLSGFTAAYERMIKVCN